MCNGFCKISVKPKIWHFHFNYGTLSMGFLFSQIWVKQSDIATCVGKNSQSLLKKGAQRDRDWLAMKEYSHSNYNVLVVLLLY